MLFSTASTNIWPGKYDWYWSQSLETLCIDQGSLETFVVSWSGSRTTEVCLIDVHHDSVFPQIGLSLVYTVQPYNTGQCDVTDCQDTFLPASAPIPCVISTRMALHAYLCLRRSLHIRPLTDMDRMTHPASLQHWALFPFLYQYCLAFVQVWKFPLLGQYKYPYKFTYMYMRVYSIFIF